MGKIELGSVIDELQTAVDLQLIEEKYKKRILNAYIEFNGESKYIIAYLEELFSLNLIKDYSTIQYLKSALTTIHELFESGYHIEY